MFELVQVLLRLRIDDVAERTIICIYQIRADLHKILIGLLVLMCYVFQVSFMQSLYTFKGHANYLLLEQIVEYCSSFI